MKFRLVVLLALFSLLYSCNPLSSIRVETIKPAKIEFPGNFNKAVFINLATDLNKDQEIDTLLYRMITEEMSLGFMDATKFSAGIDTSAFFYLKGFPLKEKLYNSDTISWTYLENISDHNNADIFIVLDTLKLSMDSGQSVNYYTAPEEYYVFRELAINAYWSVFDLYTKKRLDKYHYGDTLLWDAFGYFKTEIENKMPSVEQSIREASYFSALDYANRIFPVWQIETRYFYHLGNDDFKQAGQFVRNYEWEKAIKTWEKYIDHIDKEIASRACFNLAFANEILGKLDLAIAWAKQSKAIKNKARTRNYISLLQSRKKELKELKTQVN